MAQTLRNARFKSCLADPDIWLCVVVKPDGMRIYEYVLCYVDDFQGLEPKKFLDYLHMAQLKCLMHILELM